MQTSSQQCSHIQTLNNPLLETLNLKPLLLPGPSLPLPPLPPPPRPGLGSLDVGELLAGAAASASLTSLDLSQNSVDDVLPLATFMCGCASLAAVLNTPLPPPGPHSTSGCAAQHTPPHSSTGGVQGGGDGKGKGDALQLQYAGSGWVVAPASPQPPQQGGEAGGCGGGSERETVLAAEPTGSPLGSPPHPQQQKQQHNTPPLTHLDLSFNWIGDSLGGWVLIAVSLFPGVTHLALNHNNAAASLHWEGSPTPSNQPSLSGRSGTPGQGSGQGTFQGSVGRRRQQM